MWVVRTTRQRDLEGIKKAWDETMMALNLPLLCRSLDRSRFSTSELLEIAVVVANVILDEDVVGVERRKVARWKVIALRQNSIQTRPLDL